VCITEYRGLSMAVVYLRFGLCLVTVYFHEGLKKLYRHCDEVPYNGI
jgi:hypothetical protein